MTNTIWWSCPFKEIERPWVSLYIAATDPRSLSDRLDRLPISLSNTAPVWARSMNQVSLVISSQKGRRAWYRQHLLPADTRHILAFYFQSPLLRSDVMIRSAQRGHVTTPAGNQSGSLTTSGQSEVGLIVKSVKRFQILGSSPGAHIA